MKKNELKKQVKRLKTIWIINIVFSAVVLCLSCFCFVVFHGWWWGIFVLLNGYFGWKATNDYLTVLKLDKQIDSIKE